MSRSLDDTLSFRMLHGSPLVCVRDYHCRACRGGPAAEEYSERNDIVLLRHGAFAKHFGRRSLTADVNHAVFFSQGSTYRVSHPADCGDRGTVFVSAPHVLRDILHELSPSGDDRPERGFPFVLGPCETRVFWRHHQIVRRLQSVRADLLEPMWADVTALQIVADVLEAALSRHGLPIELVAHSSSLNRECDPSVPCDRRLSAPPSSS